MPSCAEPRRAEPRVPRAPHCAVACGRGGVAQVHMVAVAGGAGPGRAGQGARADWRRVCATGSVGGVAGRGVLARPRHAHRGAVQRPQVKLQLPGHSGARRAGQGGERRVGRTLCSPSLAPRLLVSSPGPRPACCTSGKERRAQWAQWPVGESVSAQRREGKARASC